MRAVVRPNMKTIRSVAILIVFTLLCSISAPQVRAEETTQCEEQVKACFALSIDSRDECLQSAARDPLCSGTPMGRLLEKRTQFSSIKQIDEIDGPAFLGPQRVDKRCVTKFDTAWSAGLIKGALSLEAIESLSHDLDACSVSDAHQLPRS